MSETPVVSIVIVNFNHPELIDICLRSLSILEDVPYEVVVVDNGSRPDVVHLLREFQEKGLITTLVAEPTNHFFSEGNNIGFRHTNPESEYILLVNSDVGFLRPDLLTKIVGWMEGTVTYYPSIWGLEPAVPDPGPRDIVSVGWAHDAAVEPSHARPEGFCCMIRRSVWQDMSPDFPFHYGFEEAVSKMIKAGAKCGVLSQYGSYFVHREGGSKLIEVVDGVTNRRTPAVPEWFGGLDIETLDFTLGPSEHLSYLWW